MKTLTIRVSDAEHQLMQSVAARRFMSITGITRAHFHALAEKDGLLKPEPATPAPTTPEPAAPQRTPAPTPAAQPLHNPHPNPFAHLPPVDDVMFEYPEPVDNPPPDDLA